VVEPDGFPLISGAGTASQPAIAFDGDNHLLVWQENGAGASDFVRAQRTTKAGVLLNPMTTVVDYLSSSPPAVAFNGTDYIAVVSVDVTADNVQAKQIGTDGVQVQTNAFDVADTSTTVSSVTVASNGDDYLVGWLEDANKNFMIRGVSDAGALLGAQALAPEGVSSGSLSSASLTYSGSSYMAAWCRNSTSVDLRVAKISAAGAPGTPISMAAATGGGLNTVIAGDGSGYLVSHMRLVPDPNGSNGYDVFAGRVSSTPAALDGNGFLVSSQASEQHTPDIAFNGENLLVVWHDERGSSFDIFGGLVSPSGELLTPSGIPISQAANNQQRPRVAAAGSDFLVVWEDYRNSDWDIFASRVSAAGVALNAAGIPVSTVSGDKERPDVASDGTKFMVLWNDKPTGGNDPQIRGTVVQADGDVADPGGVVIAATTSNQIGAAIVWSGSQYLAVWGDYRDATYDIWGTRLAADGDVTDAGGLQFGATLDQDTFPAVASDGTNFLIAWQDSSDILAARVESDGDLVDAIPLTVSNAANEQTSVAAAWDGTQYWLAWADEREEADYTDIYGARVLPSGEVVDTAGLALGVNGPRSELSPSLVSLGAGRAALAYERADPEPPFGAVRTKLRFLAEPAEDGTPCEDGSECESEHCVDNVCCENACDGTCEACSAAAKGTGSDGTCGDVADNTDPDVECSVDGLSCTDALCVAGACGQVTAADACLISSTCYDELITNPSNECEFCSPGDTQTAWTVDVSCGTGGAAGAGGAPGSGGEPGAGGEAGAPSLGNGGEAGVPSTGGAAGETANPGAGAGGQASGGTSASGGGGPVGSGGASACVPGQQVTCSCGDSSGVQVCRESGAGYEACSCGSDDAPSSDDGGCGCRVAQSREQRGWWGLALTLALVARRWRFARDSVMRQSPVARRQFR
jgi:hypothetical protein